MIPMEMDPEVCRVAVVARGKPLAARLRFLRQFGAKRMRVFSDEPGEGVAKRLEGKIANRLPTGDDLKGINLMFVAGLEQEESEALVKLARRRRIWVHCERNDVESDFQVPALVKRGDLTISVSTNGEFPVLARRIRKSLAETFGEEWVERMKEFKKARDVWEGNGAEARELSRMMNAFISEKNWLP